MLWLNCLLFTLAQTQDPASLSGHVVNAQGQPVADAMVFAEAMESDALATARSGPDGAYAFPALAPGLTGVFAHAPGHAFGGFSARLAPGQALAEQPITLGEPASIAGKVSGYKADAAEGARIVRVALLGEPKVSIPFDKLESFGFPIPTSGEKGKFQVDNLPAGVPVALKFSHADYPVQAVTGLAAGDRNAKAILMPGVSLSGNTLIRGEDKAVAHVDLKITNAEPPHESLTTRSDTSGRFSVRIKPGMYTVEGSSPAYRSAGLQRVTVTGEQPDQRLNLFMMPTGVIVGDVRDAKRDGAVAGAKLILESSGNPAAIAYTDANGRYRFTGASGMNRVYLSEAPGFSPGETRSMEVQVPGAGEYEMPVFYVRPVASYTIKIVDGNNSPIPGAIVTLLSPATLGWRYADAGGNASLEISAVPDDNHLAGYAQHPNGYSGAMFVLPAEETQEQLVPLAALATVRGTLVGADGAGVGGLVVAGRLIDESGRPSLVLWQTVSQPDGTFAWGGVFPNVEQQAYVFVGADATPAGAPFHVDAEGVADIGTVRVAAKTQTPSAYGALLDWKALPAVSGAPAPGALHPAVVFYVPASEAVETLETLEEAKNVISSFHYQVVLVLDGAAQPMASSLPIMQGAPPGVATTYVTDGAGKVVLETFGLPPLVALQRQR